MGNLSSYAKDELRRAGLFDKDSDYGGMMGEAVMKMIAVFEEEGHSGFSANMAINLFERLARFEPLTPLTGEPDEWEEVTTDFHAIALTEPDEEARELIDTINRPRQERVWQNKRCSHVFKEENGRAYDLQGKIFREPNGSCFTNRDSRVYITFPYTPTREYVDVERTR